MPAGQGAASVLAEIDARDPSYLRHCRVAFPPPGEAPRVLRCAGAEFRFPAGVEESLAACRSDLHARGVGLSRGEGLLCHAMAATGMDLQAAPELLARHGAGGGERRLPAETARLVAGGVQWRIWGQGEVPLVLLNANGIPLVLWSELLGDAPPPFRICVPDWGDEETGGDGARAERGIDAHAAGIARMLRAEGLHRAVVVGWSSACRLALCTAFAAAARVSHLLLLSPALSGLRGTPAQPTPFQEAQHRMLATAVQAPRLAPGISEVLRKRWLAPVQWEGLELPDTVREEMLLRLCAASAAGPLIAPFLSGDALLRYARQSLRDAQYPLDRMLPRLAGMPPRILLVTGAHDEFVSNAHTRAALRWAGLPHWEACVLGAGHYVHDLQYAYFRKLLVAFAGDELARLCLNRVALSRR